ncbi:MAG: HDIG domain-containing protein [Planctomycetia bacterium]|nr:HDIG domain-containing protein [Planctomycetia bacterium]
MSNGSPTRSRKRRAALAALPPGKWAQHLAQLRRGDVLFPLVLALTAALGIWAAAQPWVAPFPYRAGDVPPRDIVARVAFSLPAEQQTRDAQRLARLQARAVYQNNPEAIIQLRSRLVNTVVELTGAATLQDLNMDVWREFLPATPEGAMTPTREELEVRFERFRSTFSGEGQPSKFEAALAQVFAPLEKHGLLERLQHKEGDQQEILVYTTGSPPARAAVAVADVLIGKQAGDDSPLKQRLAQHPDLAAAAEGLFAWLRNRLPATLTLDPAQTKLEQEEAARSVGEIHITHPAGQKLAAGGEPLDAPVLDLLRKEHQAILASPAGKREGLARAGAMFLLIAGLFVLCGAHVALQEPRLLASRRQLVYVMAMAVAAMLLARWVSADAWRAEIIPLLLFGMTLAIAYRRTSAILLTSSLVCVTVLCLGQDIAHFLALSGVVVTALASITSIRSRLRLIEVCTIAAAAAIVLTFSLGIIAGILPDRGMMMDAGTLALWTVVAGFLITGLLPFIEKVFGVLTDLSLRELGDMSHPLLQELVRRAPGTYNHSINVASLGEAAAEAIGARGLLVRVGAYFHDIGKMLKPAYFAENQSQTDENRHESLMPAMSTLVIIAHIKDGADLARSKRLPDAIIDFILQHHGTTLVQYFYHRASEQSQATGEPEVEESHFRYPGPKPQTRESAVLMMADAVESAARTLTEPNSSRIENLVNQIAMNRLMDGQFDESGITLQELRTVQDSLIKSLIAVYHGRVKYPTPQTA